MVSMLTYTKELYDYVWSFRDTRIDAWNSNITKGSFIIPLVITYVYVAKVGGPRWMKDRKPYDVRRAILAYNILTVLANAYFLYRMLPLTLFGGGYSFLCQGTNTDHEARHGRHQPQLVVPSWYASPTSRTLCSSWPARSTRTSRTFTCRTMPDRAQWLDLAKLRQRWSGHPRLLHQRVRAHRHVHLLLPRCHGPARAEVPLVEEVPHHHPDHSTRGGLCPLVHTFVPRMRLPERAMLPRGGSDSARHCHVHELLLEDLQSRWEVRTAAGRKGKGEGSINHHASSGEPATRCAD
nr:uncharacterized protein LOC119174489 [Rhipicephalus microplus]